ncbi:MAG: VCBS repeat-containing protein [Rhodocyclaceae bacterium]|nr:VCBS repeat-containing protein [Rhodocyclaceae bacterium]MCA3021330.1 VCBS repeat-containing protein [Rhodocyclaceae bacterium]MCA3025815.1 VCBS repeat-containing protein [Rhodocyclaceae bacterium]MCA3032610.1 VCBS repeat-containing protein [Rhodocyclaceae bacterium]MCA3036354.1 VCBS repeat-containing protein [Rhodocyclaceae bacterium]
MLTLTRKFTTSLLVDVNADGFPDLVLGTDYYNGNADNIVLLNDGSGDFTKRPEVKLPRSVFGANQSSQDIVAHDVNGDGRIDLIICGTQGEPGYVGRFLQILINNGDGTFRDESSTRLIGSSSKSTGAWNRFIRLADLNGDGALDIVLNINQGYSGESVDMIWLNDGRGRYTGISSTVLADRLADVEVIDVDEDGCPDLVEVTAFEGFLQYRVFYNRTPFKALSRRAANDLDGVGKSAVVVANTQNQIQAGRLVNNQLQWSALTSAPIGFRPLGLFDLQGNGKSDLPMLNLTQGDRGDAVVWPDFQQSSAITLRQVRTLWRVDAVGDLDGDGKGDLVWRFTGNSGNIDDTGVSYVWFTDGAGVTQVRKRGGAPLDWTLLGAADLNGDGADDMLYVSPANAMRALMATPNRTCANLSAGSLPTGTTALRLGDFSGNRRGDVLALGPQNDVKLYMLNAVGVDLPPFGGAPDDPNASCTSGGSRVVAQTVKSLGTIGQGWRYLASGDFDGNGLLDVAWLQPNGAIALWLMNLGEGTPTVIVNAGSLPAGYSAHPLH